MIKAVPLENSRIFINQVRSISFDVFNKDHKIEDFQVCALKSYGNKWMMLADAQKGVTYTIENPGSIAFDYVPYTEYKIKKEKNKVSILPQAVIVDI